MPKFKKSSVSNPPAFLHEGNKKHNKRHTDGKAHPLKKVGKAIKKGVNTGKELVKKGTEVVKQAASDLKEGFESANEMSAFNLDPNVKAAKEKAIKGGFDKTTANQVFKMEPKNINKDGFKMAGNPTYQAMKLDPDSTDPNSFSVKGLDLNQTGLKVGDYFNFDNTHGSINSITDTSTPDIVKRGNSGSSLFKDAFAKARASGLSIFDFGGKKYNTNLSTDPNFGKDIMVPGQKSFKGTFNSPAIPDKPEVRIDAFDNKETRGRERKVIFQERKNKRAAIKEARAQANVDGLKGKAKRTAIKKAKNQAKLDQAQNKSNRFKTIREQSKLQEEQGINTSVGKKNRVVSEKAVKGSSSTPAKLGHVSFKDFVAKQKSDLALTMKPAFKMKGLKMNYKK